VGSSSSIISCQPVVNWCYINLSWSDYSFCLVLHNKRSKSLSVASVASLLKIPPYVCNYNLMREWFSRFRHKTKPFCTVFDSYTTGIHTNKIRTIFNTRTSPVIRWVPVDLALSFTFHIAAHGGFWKTAKVLKIKKKEREKKKRMVEVDTVRICISSGY